MNDSEKNLYLGNLKKMFDVGFLCKYTWICLGRKYVTVSLKQKYFADKEKIITWQINDKRDRVKHWQENDQTAKSERRNNT